MNSPTQTIVLKGRETGKIYVEGEDEITGKKKSILVFNVVFLSRSLRLFLFIPPTRHPAPFRCLLPPRRSCRWGERMRLNGKVLFSLLEEVSGHYYSRTKKIKRTVVIASERFLQQWLFLLVIFHLLNFYINVHRIPPSPLKHPQSGFEPTSTIQPQYKDENH